LGVRQIAATRQALARSIQSMDTVYGPIRVKVARLPGGGVKAAPEYEDCRRAAELKGVPLRTVYQAAESAAEALVR
jgi:uncharacterized protein (DUF111 family)